MSNYPITQNRSGDLVTAMNIYTLNPRLSQNKKFYVYSWLRAKPSKNGDIGSPYYIGKGCGNRAFKINRMFIPKSKSNIKFIAENMNEIDALQLEMLMIYYYGRLDLGTGCLYNKNEGGNQPPNQKGVKKSKEFVENHIKRMIGNTFSKGKPQSKESNMKRSTAMTGKFLNRIVPENEKWAVSIVSRHKLKSKKHKDNISIGRLAGKQRTPEIMKEYLRKKRAFHITQEIINEIRILYDYKIYMQKDLAILYRMSQGSISNIILGNNRKKYARTQS